MGSAAIVVFAVIILFIRIAFMFAKSNQKNKTSLILQDDPEDEMYEEPLDEMYGDSVDLMYEDPEDEMTTVGRWDSTWKPAPEPTKVNEQVETIEQVVDQQPEQPVQLMPPSDEGSFPESIEESIEESTSERDDGDLESVEESQDVDPVNTEVPEESAIPEDIDEGAAITFCGLLFKEGEMSTEIEKKFEEYIGQTVEWTGTLERFSEFRYDFVFGEKPGVLANFDIYRITSAYGGGTSVKAIVHFANEAEKLLEESKDQKVTFTGTLLKISAFSKQIFVTDGTISA